jgi:glucose-1-phosphatase
VGIAATFIGVVAPAGGLAPATSAAHTTLVTDAEDIRLVVFDLGGVMVRVATWEEAHRAAGLTPERFPGDSFTEAIRGIVREFDGGVIEPDEFEVRATAASGGIYSRYEIQRVHDRIVVGEYEGFATVFDALDDAGVATGILSNTNHVHWQTLAALDGRAPRFPAILRAKHVYASHLLKLLKPDRAIFERVSAETGFAPAEILFFDDLEANVVGARAAGWRAQQVDASREPVRQILGVLQQFGVIARGSA